MDINAKANDARRLRYILNNLEEWDDGLAKGI